MKTLIVASGVALALTAAPALAYEDEPASQDAEELDPYAPDAVRCESRPVTGSRARRIRVCMTNAEWEDLRDAGNRDATRVLDDATRDHTNRNLDPGT